MKMHWTRSSVKAAVCGVGAATLALSGVVLSAVAEAPASTAGATNPLVAAVPKLLTNTIPSVISTATRLGAIAPSTAMTVIAPLELSHTNQLNSYVQAEYTPGSPTYHQFLSPTGFANYFGATTARVNAVTHTLDALGFTVAPVAANRLYVKFTGPAALIEQTFSTVIDRLPSRVSPPTSPT
jgi:pseudomonalisin